MPRTPPTIVAPLPKDFRVLALAKATGLTRREAFGAAAEAWEWMLGEAEDDIVPRTAVDALDVVVDIAGFGQAMLEAALVGTVDGGLVLPAELRNQQRDERGGRATAAAEDQGDKKERERKGARIRKRRSRANKALTTPASKDTSVTPAVGAAVKRMPRCLGTVDGFPVMLLWGSYGPFYKLAGASPKEWTGTATNPKRPSFADALVSLHAAMKRDAGKGLGGGDSFRPSLKAMVDEAERYRASRTSEAADDARRDEANQAAAEAAAEDQEDAEHEPAGRDSHAHVTPDQRDTVTVTVSSRPESVTCPSNFNDGGDLGNVDCHAHVTEPAPSSSSSLSVSCFHEDKSKENTTTTSGVTPAERDHEDRILDRILGDGQEGQSANPATAAQRELFRLYADGLGEDIAKVQTWMRCNRPYLSLRLKAAGIDSKTGLRVSAEGSHEPVDARHDISVTTEPIAGDKPAAGSVDARDDDARLEDEDPDHPRHDSLDTLMALKRNGIPLPMLMGAPGRGHHLDDVAFEHDEQASVVGIDVGHGH
jgi:hypothetical protein